MFWELDDWIVVDANERSYALETLKQALPKHECATFALAEPDTRGSNHRGLPVQAIRTRKLRFYPDDWLYELDISCTAAGFGARYESARAFVVLHATNKSNTASTEVDAALPPHRRSQSDARTGDHASAVRLDWTSGTIHQLNKQFEMQLAP